VRAVGQVEKRLKEAARLGFERAIVAARSACKMPKDIKIEPVGVTSLRDAIDLAFAGAKDQEV